MSHEASDNLVSMVQFWIGILALPGGLLLFLLATVPWFPGNMTSLQIAQARVLGMGTTLVCLGFFIRYRLPDKMTWTASLAMSVVVSIFAWAAGREPAGPGGG